MSNAHVVHRHGQFKPGAGGNVGFYGWNIIYDGETDDYINVFLVDDSASMRSSTSNGKRIMDYAFEKAEEIFYNYLPEEENLATRALWFKFHYELDFFENMAKHAGACWKKKRWDDHDPYTLVDWLTCEWWTCRGGGTALWASGIID